MTSDKFFALTVAVLMLAIIVGTRLADHVTASAGLPAACSDATQ